MESGQLGEVNTAGNYSSNPVALDFGFYNNVIIAAFAFSAFGLAAYIGIELTESSGRVAAIWPANAILLAIIWRLCKNLSVLVLITAFVGNVFADILQGDDLAGAISLSLVNTIEVVGVYYILRMKRVELNDRSNFREIVWFISVAGIAVPAVSAAIASIYFELIANVPFLRIWKNWFVGDALGMLTVGPALLFFSYHEIRVRYQSSRPFLYFASWLMFLGVLGVVFLQHSFPLLFLVFPALILLTYVSGFSAACIGLLLMTIVSVDSTMIGLGPINMIEADIVTKAHMLQIFLASAVLSMLPISVQISVVRRALDQSHKDRLIALENEQAAKEASRAKSDFLTSMSHELRTPLNAIYGFSQILQTSENIAGKEEADFTRSILAGSRHLMAMMDDILDLAKIEHNKMTVSLEPVEVKEVVSRVVTINASVADERKVTVNYSQSLDSFYVFADLSRLTQILLNLTSNAIKYNRPGGYVQIYATQNDSRVKIFVEDNGLGVAEQEVPNLFEEFNRCGAQFGTEHGAGVGLALSRRLVEMMGGSIGYSPKATGGSVFWIEIPAADVEHAVSSAYQEVNTHQDNQPMPVYQSSKRHSVVYVEDNDWNSRLMPPALSIFENLEVISAQDGMTGLDVIRKVRPDLIILDLHLPDMSGFDVLANIRSDPSLADVPVFALTADATKSTQKKCIEAGFNQYISKPFALEELRALIRNALEGYNDPSVSAVAHQES